MALEERQLMNTSLDPQPEAIQPEQLGERLPVSPGRGSPICGIYGIWCEANEKWYVGQSVDVKKRWWAHADALRKGTHPNRYLQRVWAKHGGGSLLFVVLWRGPRGDLDQQENRFIAELESGAPQGFNLREGGTCGGFSLEARGRMSAAKKGKPRGPCPEQTRLRIKNTLLGQKHSRERVEQSRRGQHRRYLARSEALGERPGLKRCRKCGELLPVGCFAPAANNLSGRHSWCRECHNADKRARRRRLTQAPNSDTFALDLKSSG